MPGVLFYPWQANLPPPVGATAEHRRGWWCHQADWPSVAERYSTALKVAWLAKPHWLAPPSLDAFGNANERMEAVAQVSRYGPQQVMLYDPKENCWKRTTGKEFQERPLTHDDGMTAAPGTATAKRRGSPPCSTKLSR